MKRRIAPRALSLVLVLSLLLTTLASALTPQQTREILNLYYVDPVPSYVLEQATTEDMLRALGDPYTEYFSPQAYKDFLGSMEDVVLMGVGISMEIVPEGAKVARVLPGGTAEAGGMLAGDLIVAVDGKRTAGGTTESIKEMIQGAEGTTVTLEYLRDGTAHTITLKRAPVVVPNTETELLNGHIGYIASSAFGTTTATHFAEGLAAYGDQADSWIIDLLYNGGGMTQAAMDVAALFVGPNTMCYLKEQGGQVNSFGSNLEAVIDQPVILLTGPNTASASELLSAALRDYGAGLVVGGRSYGKGVAQSLLDETILPDHFADGSALKVTTSRFYSPAGNTNQLIGVIPDLLVPWELAPAVALLLSSQVAEGESADVLTVKMGWNFDLDLNLATSEEFRPAFTALLEALPSTANLFLGTGGAGWTPTTPEQVAQQYGMTDYQPRGFSDSDLSRHQQSIDLLATYDILKGDGTGAFQPKATLTRAQLCALLAQAMNCRPFEGKNAFSDVPSDSWYSSAVNSLAAMGLVSGTGNGQFRPDDPVDHSQFITIMARAASWMNLGLALEEMPADASKTATIAAYPQWAQEGVWLLGYSQKGLMNNRLDLLWDPAESISPTATTTREEAASLLYSILSHLGILYA